MGVNFSAFEIGRRALHASQFGIAVTGQNIANVNTKGYSRQAVQLSSAPSGGSSRLQIGTGVSIVGVQQFRDQFVATRLQTETGINGRLTAQRDALSPVDAAFNESDGNGISASISAFFGSFRALEANPVSIPLRADVITKATAMTNAFSSTRARLVEIRNGTDAQLRSDVGQLNQLSQQVVDLNVRIATAENSGGTAAELRDQRDLVVQQVAELSGARAVETDGMVTLTLSDGHALVSGSHFTPIDIQNQPNGLSSLTIAGQPAVIGDGRLRGLQNAIGIVGGQIQSLDDLATSITTRVNTIHTGGTDSYGNAAGNFFQVPASGPVTANNFSVTAAVRADPRLISASPMTAGSAAATVAGAIADLLTDPSSTSGARTGSFSSIYSSIVSDAGKEVRTVEDGLVTQQAIMSQAQAQRDATSGVSLDEEAINLLQFQKSYEAAAKFLKIADELTQTILALG
jgi:flagellar hook-associated protein 1 FlgK